MAQTLENQGFQRFSEACGDHEKSAFHLPQQDLPGIIKSLKSSYIPSSLSIFCVSTSILPTIYQYFWRVRLANATAVKKAQKELNDIERNKAP